MVKAMFYNFVLKPDYFPYFKIKIMLGYLAILFRCYGSFFQVTSNSPKNHCFNQKNET